jgi:transcriptional regulator with XRE-family HTH domain
MGVGKNPLAVHFGKRLRACRKRAGVSQTALCSRASLNRTEVGLLEQGVREPQLGTIIKLAGALSVPLEELLAGIGWRSPGYCPGEFELRDPDDAPLE